MNTQVFLKNIQEKGWVRFKGVYDEELVNKVNFELEHLDKIYSPVQKEAGVYDRSRNAYHHTIMVCRSMLELIDPNPINEFLETFFGGKYILNTMGVSIVMPKVDIYTQQVHRDVRSFTGNFRLLINTLIMLDDSTEDNGATWMYSGSHKMPDKPTDEEFYANAEQAIGSKGDVLMFDGNIWHAAGKNNSPQRRRIITPIYTKPFMKQQLDYPRAFGYDFARTISPELRQTLGYNALVPTRLDEFYQPAEKRFFKMDQG